MISSALVKLDFDFQVYMLDYIENLLYLFFLIQQCTDLMSMLEMFHLTNTYRINLRTWEEVFNRTLFNIFSRKFK